MRKAINENPKVQAGVIGFLLIAGVLLFMKMSKGPEPVATTDPAATEAAAVTGTGAGAVSADGAPVPGATAAPTAAAPTTGAVAVAPTASGTVSPEALIPGPGLPRDVAQAYARGNAIVLLIVKEGSTDDELVKDSVNRLSKPGVSIFVAPASKIARYSRIAQGAGVNRTPALVVVRPRRTGGDAPEAIVSYGFRDSQSVVQAVEDALYTGRDDAPYHPG